MSISIVRSLNTNRWSSYHLFLVFSDRTKEMDIHSVVYFTNFQQEKTQTPSGFVKHLENIDIDLFLLILMRSTIHTWILKYAGFIWPIIYLVALWRLLALVLASIWSSSRLRSPSSTWTLFSSRSTELTDIDLQQIQLIYFVQLLYW